jgi:vacuolar-type H+-ATPase subunit E/Vma4
MKALLFKLIKQAEKKLSSLPTNGNAYACWELIMQQLDYALMQLITGEYVLASNETVQVVLSQALESLRKGPQFRGVMKRFIVSVEKEMK